MTKPTKSRPPKIVPPSKPAFLGASQKLLSFLSSSDWDKASLLLKNWSFSLDDAFNAAIIALAGGRDDLVLLAFQSAPAADHEGFASRLLDRLLPRTHDAAPVFIDPPTHRVLKFISPLLTPDDLTKCVNVGAKEFSKIISQGMTYKNIAAAIRQVNSAPDLTIFDDLRALLPSSHAAEPSLLRTLFSFKHHDWFECIVQSDPKRSFQYGSRHKLPAPLMTNLINLIPNSCAQELVASSPPLKLKWPLLAAKASAWELAQTLDQEPSAPTISKHMKRM